MSFFNELKRRNVFRVAAAYIIVGWLIMQAGEVMAPALNLPDWVNSLLAFFLILGFPVAVVFAWAYEMTPDGLKKEKDVDRTKSITDTTGHKLNFTIIVLLAAALAYIAFDKFVLDPERDAKLVNATQEVTEQQPTPQSASKATVPDDNSIAVLPFINMSSDPEQEYFSDGITEEVLNLLAKIPELKVTSRSSVFSFKGQNVDMPTVAAKLGVAHILEGSVRKAGDRVRITAQLIKADSDMHIWSETYDRELNDVFAIQDEISREVVTALQVQLFGEAPSIAPTNTEAYNLFLKGKYFDALGERTTWESAVSAFEAAIAIDPHYAPAWAALSFTQQSLANLSYIEPNSGFESARQSAIRALELDDSLADAWAALARIQNSFDMDWERAEGTIRTALQYGPRNVVALESASAITRTTGRMGQSIAYAQQAVELDPLSLTSMRTLGIAYWAAGRHAEAESIYRQILELYPEQVTIRAFIAASLSLQDKPEEAKQFIDFSSENLWQRFISALVLQGLGRQQDSEQVLQDLMLNEAEVMAYQIACIHAMNGSTDMAFEWIELAYQQKDGGLSQLLYDPFLVSLHGDPRWEETLLKAGMLDYWKEQRTKVGSDQSLKGDSQ